MSPESIVRQDVRGDPAALSAFSDLLGLVFETGRGPGAVGPFGAPMGIFEPDGRCVAGLDMFALPLIADGRRVETMGIRSVAVHPDRRGRGLFRTLMTQALARHDQGQGGPILLYTEESALYHRFGFREVAQHKVVGPPPPAPHGPRSSVRRLTLDRHADLLAGLLAARTPVSDHVAIDGGAALFLARAASETLAIDHCIERQVLVVTEPDDDTTIVVDVVAGTMPSLAVILHDLGRSPGRVEVLFPTDRLAWSGHPEPEDTGLMIRGEAPTAFASPFMLPPTAEF